jgi:predicted LPLAT superfamily acyltransferase
MNSMSATRGQHWAQINESSFVAGMRLLFWICRYFGRWPFRAVLYPMMVWYMIAKPAARQASIDYLRRIAATGCVSGIKAGNVTVLRHFASFGESILDKMLLWSGLFNAERVVFYGQQQVVAETVAKRGALLICPHLGNLDLCRVLAKNLPGFKMTLLIHTKHAKTFNRMLAQLDPASQADIMQVTELSAATAIVLAEKISRGEFIVISGDRIPVSAKPRVAFVNFLGALAPFPVGPYILASLLQCPTYLLFSMRAGRISEVHFELFRETIRLPRRGREEALTRLTAEYAARLEHFCLRAPLQWFNFYDFWDLPAVDVTHASC